MAEAYLPVSSSVYDTINELHKKLQAAYGDDVTVSDTIDFLGHQFFVHQRLLDIAQIALTRMAVDKKVPEWLNNALHEVGLHMPQDATCFIRANIDVPIHWASTRWLLDVEGSNVMKCLSEPEAKAGDNESEVSEERKRIRRIKIE